MWRDDAYLLDIALAARRALGFTREMTEDEFEASPIHQDAVMRCVTIIGEAAGKLSEPLRSAHPEIPWHEMTGMRNRLVHDYRHVDVPRVWHTVRESLPKMLGAIEPLVPGEGVVVPEEWEFL
jgi:uncharacterized protein with HEPN domain